MGGMKELRKRRGRTPFMPLPENVRRAGADALPGVLLAKVFDLSALEARTPTVERVCAQSLRREPRRGGGC